MTITEAIPTAPRRRAFSVWYKDLARWDIGSFSTLSWAWPPAVMRPLGSVLTRVIREVDTTDLRSIPIIEKITFGGVASVLPIDDRDGYKGRLFWAEPGQFVYSRIRAKQGSFTVVEPTVGRLAVSQEYPVYDISRDRIDPEFLKLALRSRAFLSLMAGLSHGGSTKTRMLPDQFESLKIPVPPLTVQRRTVAAATKAGEQAARFRAEADQQLTETKQFILKELGLRQDVSLPVPRSYVSWWSDTNRWGVHMCWNDSHRDLSGRYPMEPLGGLCRTGTGGTPSRTRHQYFGGGIPWVKTTEVRNDVILRTEETLTEEGLKNSQAQLYEPGCLIMALYGQGATRGRVSKLGIRAATNQACLVMYDFTERVQVDFVWMYLQLRYDALRSLASGNNQPNLSAELVRPFPVSVPPHEVQTRLATLFFTSVKHKVETERAAEALMGKAAALTERMILGELQP